MNHKVVFAFLTVVALFMIAVITFIPPRCSFSDVWYIVGMIAVSAIGIVVGTATFRVANRLGVPRWHTRLVTGILSAAGSAAVVGLPLYVLAGYFRGHNNNCLWGLCLINAYYGSRICVAVGLLFGLGFGQHAQNRTTSVQADL